MEKWKILKTPDTEEKLQHFKKQYPERAGEAEKLLDDIRNYPAIRWATVFKDSDKFIADRNQQLRFAGKAYPAEKTIVLSHFSYHA